MKNNKRLIKRRKLAIAQKNKFVQANFYVQPQSNKEKGKSGQSSDFFAESRSELMAVK
jgi:hypothetical protein